MFESISNGRFFLSVFRPRTDIKNKTVTKTVLPIFPISPHDVISFLLPNGQKDKKNGRLLKIEEAKKPLFCTSHDGPTRSISF